MTECARCGDCCEKVHINAGPGDLTARLADPYYAGRARRDTQWIRDHMTPTGELDPTFSNAPIWLCSAFDPDGRLCTAHADRPRMCSEFPWYANEPDTFLFTQLLERWKGVRHPTDDPDRPEGTVSIATLPRRCSFWADVPEDARPPGAVLLPVVATS